MSETHFAQVYDRALLFVLALVDGTHLRSTLRPRAA